MTTHQVTFFLAALLLPACLNLRMQEAESALPPDGAVVQAWESWAHASSTAKAEKWTPTRDFAVWEAAADFADAAKATADPGLEHHAMQIRKALAWSGTRK